MLVHYLSDAPFQLRACSCGVSSFFADGKVEVKSLTIALAFPNKHSLNQVSPSSGVQIAFAFSDTQKVFLHGTSILLLSFKSVSSRLCWGGIRFVLDPLPLQGSLLTSVLIYVAAVFDVLCAGGRSGERCVDHQAQTYCFSTFLDE